MLFELSCQSLAVDDIVITDKDVKRTRRVGHGWQSGWHTGRPVGGPISVGGHHRPSLDEESKGGSFPINALCLDPATLKTAELFGDVETESTAAHLAVHIRVCLAEAPE